ncbi:YdcF family protein [Paludibacterium yongneupense]|uniref:YdcF family protein n=1 Tax=Paludibacterium yongneupense TaxID=400061 RepID=UPI0003F6D06B|nr:YdcF family protein [Paludibacterium yongneupense]
MIATTRPEVLLHMLFGAFLLPPGCLLLLGLYGVRQLRRGRGAAAALLSLFGFYLISTPWLALRLNAPLEAASPVLDMSALPAFDAIVVLGGGKHDAPEFGGEQASSDTLLRLRYAARLARISGKPVLTSGGAPLGGIPEAQIMARTLHDDYGVPVRWTESESVNTAANARLSAAMLHAAGVRRIALVSQGWHLRRAAALFRAQGLTVLPAPTGLVRYEATGSMLLLPGAQAQKDVASALREWLALAGERL